MQFVRRFAGTLETVQGEFRVPQSMKIIIKKDLALVIRDHAIGGLGRDGRT